LGTFYSDYLAAFLRNPDVWIQKNVESPIWAGKISELTQPQNTKKPIKMASTKSVAALAHL